MNYLSLTVAQDNDQPTCLRELHQISFHDCFNKIGILHFNENLYVL